MTCIWYVRTMISPFYFLSEVYDLFQYRVYYVLFYLFSSCGNLPLQIYWSLSCDHGLHCSDEEMWKQQQNTLLRVIPNDTYLKCFLLHWQVYGDLDLPKWPKTCQTLFSFIFTPFTLLASLWKAILVGDRSRLTSICRDARKNLPWRHHRFI